MRRRRVLKSSESAVRGETEGEGDVEGQGQGDGEGEGEGQTPSWPRFVQCVCLCGSRGCCHVSDRRQRVRQRLWSFGP